MSSNSSDNESVEQNADNAGNQQSNVHLRLNLRPRVVGLCANYGRERGKCSNPNCMKLHVCRAWLGGLCLVKGCTFAHQLRNDEHNSEVLRKNSIPLLECEDNLRHELLQTFPRICIHYNLGMCKFQQCSKMHFCSDMATSGRCRAARCVRNHDVRKSGVMAVLQSYDMEVPERIRDFQLFFADAVCADAPAYRRDCKCQVSNSDEVELHDQDSSVNAIPAKSYESDFNTDRYPNRAKDRPSRNEAHSSDDEEYVRLTNEVRLDAQRPRPVPVPVPVPVPMHRADRSMYQVDTASSEFNLRNLILFLLHHDGCTPAEAVRVKFRLPLNFDFREWLNEERHRNRSVMGERVRYVLYVADKSSAPYFCLYRFFRICHFYNFERCPFAECDYLHVCRMFIAGLCESPALCGGLSHDLDRCLVFQSLGVGSWPSERKLHIVRASHPQICSEYAYRSHCPAKQTCPNLHMCNNYLIPTGHGPESFRCDASACSLFHGFFYPQNTAILTRFGLEQAPQTILRRLTLPASKIRPGPNAAFASARFDPQQTAWMPPNASRLPTPLMSVPVALGMLEAKHSLTDLEAYANPGSNQHLYVDSANMRAPYRNNTRKDWSDHQQSGYSDSQSNPFAHRMASQKRVVNVNQAAAVRSAGHSQSANQQNPFVHPGLFGHQSRAVAPLKRFRLCEPFLRNACKTGEACDKFHYEKAFCWVYELSDVTSNGSSAVNEVFELGSSRWAAFSPSDNDAIESAYCDPTQRTWFRAIDVRETYPFGGRSELLFTNQRARESAANEPEAEQALTTFMLQTRIKKRDAQNDAVSLARLVDIRVACLRTVASAFVAPSSTHTQWVWYFMDNDSGNWIDVAQLVGDKVSEIELTFISGASACVVRPRSGGYREKELQFNFDTMLVTSTDKFEAELLARPRCASYR